MKNNKTPKGIDWNRLPERIKDLVIIDTTLDSLNLEDLETKYPNVASGTIVFQQDLQKLFQKIGNRYWITPDFDVLKVE